MDAMLTENQLLSSYRIARAAIDLAEEHQITPVSFVYELFVDHLAGEDAELSRSLELALSKPTSERNLLLSEIHDARTSERATLDGLEKVRSGLASELSEVSSSVAKGVDGNMKLAAELRRSLRDLAGMVTREELQLVCRQLVYSGREQLNDTQGLARQLERTQFQLNEMHKDLAELRDKSARDALTGLYNIDHFATNLEELISLRAPFCIALLDVDDMTGLNAAWGHTVGDNILRGLGELLRKHLKGKDVPCRLSGQQFGILMPDTPLAGAAAISESLRARFAKITWVSQSTDVEIGQRSISLGVAAWASNDTAELLLDRSRDALAGAKQNGGNQVGSGR